MSRLTRLAPKGKRTDFMLQCIKAALAEARAAHPTPFVDAHHMLGVLEEEIHELRQKIFKRKINVEHLQSELLQCCAVCLRGLEDVTLQKKGQR